MNHAVLQKVIEEFAALRDLPAEASPLASGTSAGIPDEVLSALLVGSMLVPKLVELGVAQRVAASLSMGFKDMNPEQIAKAAWDIAAAVVDEGSKRGKLV